MNTHFYSVEDAVKEINNPFLNTRPKMFKFLRKFGMIVGHLPLVELIEKGFFIVESFTLKRGCFSKDVTVIRITEKGIALIRNFAKLIFN